MGPLKLPGCFEFVGVGMLSHWEFCLYHHRQIASDGCGWFKFKKRKERRDKENRSSEHTSEQEIIYLKFLLNKVKVKENSGLWLKQPQDTSKPAHFPHVSTCYLKLTAINGKPPHLAKHRGPPQPTNYPVSSRSPWWFILEKGTGLLLHWRGSESIETSFSAQKVYDACTIDNVLLHPHFDISTVKLSFSNCFK